MEEPTATLLAAIIAAGASVLTLLHTTATKRAEEVRLANRAVLAGDLKAVGKAIHEVIALSNIQMKNLNDPIHPERYRKAAEAARRLKALRQEIRYSLWGLDGGFRELTRLPDWIGHAKIAPEVASELFKLAKLLGEQLDQGVRSAYLHGRPPGLWRQFLVNRRARALRQRYERFSKSRRMNCPSP